MHQNQQQQIINTYADKLAKSMREVDNKFENITKIITNNFSNTQPNEKREKWEIIIQDSITNVK